MLLATWPFKIGDASVSLRLCLEWNGEKVGRKENKGGKLGEKVTFSCLEMGWKIREEGK